MENFYYFFIIFRYCYLEKEISEKAQIFLRYAYSNLKKNCYIKQNLI